MNQRNLITRIGVILLAIGLPPLYNQLAHNSISIDNGITKVKKTTSLLGWNEINLNGSEALIQGNYQMYTFRPAYTLEGSRENNEVSKVVIHSNIPADPVYSPDREYIRGNFQNISSERHNKIFDGVDIKFKELLADYNI